MSLVEHGTTLNNTQMPRLTIEQQLELQQIWRSNGYLADPQTDQARAELYRLMQVSELIYRHERGLLE